MSYTKYFIRENRFIPLPLTVILIIFMVVLISNVANTNKITTKASQTKLKNLNVVNTLNNQAGIFWQTEKQESGWVVYGEKEDELVNTVVDERDISEKKGQFLNHYAIIKNLQAQTRYFFKIVSEKGLITDIGGKAFSFVTSSSAASGANLKPGYGTIIKQNGNPAEGISVLLFLKGAAPLFTQSKVSGEWLISLNSLIDERTSKPFSPLSNEKVTIKLYGEDSEESTVETDISNISPLPQTIILGKNYVISEKGNVLPASTQNEDKSDIAIVFPLEGAIIPGSTPLIKGTALPNQLVTVAITTKTPTSYKTTSDKEGVWKILIDKPLSVGSYNLTMFTQGKDKKAVTLKRSFSIAKSGEQVLGEATEEATPTVVPPTSTPSPVLSVTTTPDYSPYPTTELTPTPPVSGSLLIPYSMIVSGSLILLGLGIMLVF